MHCMAGTRLRLQYALALAITIQCSSAAFALNPALEINQYAHTAWTIRDGFFRGSIQSIAQTPDGFLWLGTGIRDCLGLMEFMRFPGRRRGLSVFQVQPFPA